MATRRFGESGPRVGGPDSWVHGGKRQPAQGLASSGVCVDVDDLQLFRGSHGHRYRDYLSLPIILSQDETNSRGLKTFAFS